MRWAELDPQRIVFNAHYLTYFDVALSEYLRAIGFKAPDGLAKHGCDIVLANANLDFRASARYDDELLVPPASPVSAAQPRFRMACFRDDTLLVEGAAGLCERHPRRACADAAAGALRRQGAGLRVHRPGAQRRLEQIARRARAPGHVNLPCEQTAVDGKDWTFRALAGSF